MRFDAFVWPLTDPETGVGTSPLAEVPCLPELSRSIRLRYQAPGRWSAIDRVVTLKDTGFPEWREFLAAYDVSDVATVPFADAFGCWGFLDLWRHHKFTPGEVALLEAIRPVVTTALRRCQAASITALPSEPAVESRAVMLLSPELEVRRATDQSDELLRRLLPTEADRAPVPAGAYNVAAQLLANESGVDARPAQCAGLLGRRPTARLSRRTSAGRPDIAVTIGPVHSRERLSFLALACGLSPREREVLECLADGDDTRTVARRLFDERVHSPRPLEVGRSEDRGAQPTGPPRSSDGLEPVRSYESALAVGSDRFRLARRADPGGGDRRRSGDAWSIWAPSGHVRRLHGVGSCLTFIEDFIRDEVLPRYANTHTESRVRDYRRLDFARRPRADPRCRRWRRRHVVIFAGSGTTGAIDKLIGIMGLRIAVPTSRTIPASAPRSRRTNARSCSSAVRAPLQ